MHAIFFAVKRVHLGALREERWHLAGSGLTPARYDLVQAMAELAAPLGRAARRQSELWKALGVSRSTVSKMLERMETLGLVRRSVDKGDRRQRWVELTRAGAAAFRLARRLALAPVAALVDRLFPECGYRWTPPPGAALVPDEDVAPDLARAIGRARRGLRDRADLAYALVPRPPEQKWRRRWRRRLARLASSAASRCVPLELGQSSRAFGWDAFEGRPFIDW